MITARGYPPVKPTPQISEDHVSTCYFTFWLVRRLMPSFLPLGRRIEPWPAGTPGNLNRALLASLADEVYLAETSPMVHKTPPIVAEGEYLAKQIHEVSIRLTNLYFCRLADGRVVCPPVAVINRRKDIFGDISVDWRHPRTNHKYRGWKFVRSPLRLSGNGLCLAATGAETFFHLLFDSLGRLWLAEKAGFSLQDFDHLIVQQDTPLLRRFLELLGGGTDRLVDLSKVRHVCCENLFACSYQSGPGHYHPDFISWLRTRIQSKSRNSEKRVPQKIIFLSRRYANSRHLLNEDEAVKAFPREKVQQVSLERHTLDEQIDIFQHAGGVVAPHGGGLSHLAWAQPGLPVLELFPEGFFNACYWELASTAQARYGCAEADCVGKGNFASRNFIFNPKLAFELFSQLQQ
jgi:hypothetical protein